MTTQSVSAPNSAAAARASWLPLIIIVLAQLQMGFNINALPVSIGPIAEDLNAPATAIGTALVVYSLFGAAFVMLGAKIGKLFGERRVFQVSVIAHGASMALMALSATAGAMNIAQAISAISAAALVPTLVVLIAANYRDRQQAQALGILASIPAVASGVAFVIAGFIATVSKGAVFVFLLRLFLDSGIYAYTTLTVVLSRVAVLSIFAGNVLFSRLVS